MLGGREPFTDPSLESVATLREVPSPMAIGTRGVGEAKETLVSRQLMAPHEVVEAASDRVAQRDYQCDIERGEFRGEAFFYERREDVAVDRTRVMAGVVLAGGEHWVPNSRRRVKQADSAFGRCGARRRPAREVITVTRRSVRLWASMARPRTGNLCEPCDPNWPNAPRR